MNGEGRSSVNEERREGGEKRRGREGVNGGRRSMREEGKKGGWEEGGEEKGGKRGG